MLLTTGIWLFGRRRYFYIWLALGAIWLYALITGMHPPVVRAAIMASIFLTAELLGRQRSAITALAFAAAIMVGLEPQILGTVSFQMSFLAMTGLIFIFPQLRDLGRKLVAATLGKYQTVVPIANLVSDSFSVTLGAVIAVWPVIAYHFGIVSLVGPLVTFLALPALPGIIVAGALAASLGLIALPAAQVMGWLTWPFVSYLLLLVNGFAALPISAVEAGPANPVLIWAYYPTLALVLWFISHRQRASHLAAKSLAAAKPAIDKMGGFFSRLPKKWLIPPLVVIAVLVSAAVLTAPDDKLHISFLDVGQGDAILIQKGSRQILIDGGPSPQAITLELSDKMPFWDRTIDLLVLTHPHADHITGLVEVLGEYRVEQVLYAGLDYDLPIYSQWLKLLDEQGIRGTTARAGQQMELGGVVIEVLNPQHPLLAGTDSDIDNNGVVLRVSLGEISFLLTADIMWPAELELINQRQVSGITVLKVAHHGSETSTTAGFLAVTSPRLAVISVGADNSFGHPDPDILARLEEELGSDNIYRTDLQGTIEFITDGQRLWVRVE
jgi:competence protein ComEC